MYVNDNLLPDEEIIYFTRPHWIIFGSAIAVLVIAFIILFYGARFMGIGLRIYSLEIYEIMSLLCFILAGISGFAAFIRYVSSEYAVTNKRILIKTGWISRNVFELFLTKVEALQVQQSIPGRLLNYGVLVVVGTGGTHDLYPFVPDPLNFRRTAQLEVDRLGSPSAKEF